jgi:NAD(P)-dependent dehydrogenase (short-subunit alcohol dehydrogenase family)
MPSRPLSALTSTRTSTPASPRRVLVTGGASGLGLALVRALVARGDHVLATDVQADRPDALPEAAAYLPLDVRSDEAWAAALAHVRQTWGGLDLLVNNAGVAAGGRIDVATMDEWHWIVDINLLGVVRGCRTFTPLFKEQGSGHIVNTASLAGLVHAPGMAAYNTVKAGVVALSETLSHELAPHGIDVSVVCPSFFRTNLGSSFQGADTEMESAGKKLVSGSKRSAEQVADIVVRGIDARRDVILTDRDGQIAWRAKRFARPAYTAVMKRAARRVAAGR